MESENIYNSNNKEREVNRVLSEKEIIDVLERARELALPLRRAVSRVIPERATQDDFRAVMKKASARSAETREAQKRRQQRERGEDVGKPFFATLTRNSDPVKYPDSSSRGEQDLFAPEELRKQTGNSYGSDNE